MAKRTRRQEIQFIRSDGWQKILTSANIIIALCALSGIWFTFQQNKQTSNILSKAGEAFDSIAYPVVMFSKYQWFISSKIPTCENPPVSMNVYYRNKSGVPVALEDVNLEIFIGERPYIGEREKSLVGGEVILAPGEELGAEVGEKKLFEEYYPKMDDRYIGPRFNFILTVIYRSLITGKRYEYKGKVILRNNCDYPNQVAYQRGKETIKELKYKH